MDHVPSLFPELDELHASRSKTRIYFGLGVNGHIKIGLTGRANGRRGGEMHFTELCSVPGGRDVERSYRAKYGYCRIGKTEWHHADDRLLMDLTVMCAEQGKTGAVLTLRNLIETRLRQRSAA